MIYLLVYVSLQSIDQYCIRLLYISGGIVENRLLSKDDLLHVATLPSHDQLLGQTVSLLGSAASQTHSLLNRHQQELSQNLAQYVKDQQGKET